MELAGRGIVHSLSVHARSTWRRPRVELAGRGAGNKSWEPACRFPAFHMDPTRARPCGQSTPAETVLALPVGLEPTPPEGVGRGKIRFPTEFHRRELPPPRPCGAFRCICKPCGLAQAPIFPALCHSALSYGSRIPSVRVRAAQRRRIVSVASIIFQLLSYV